MRYRKQVRWMLVLAAILAVGTPPEKISAISLEKRLTSTSYGIDFWRAAEGLPQSRIRAITRTRDGYLWLATDNGLVRFNGSTFKAFTIETGSLKDNEVWALQEDNDRGLWIGTYGGGLTLLKGGTFRTFTTADGLPDDIIRQVVKDEQGNIWMITPKGACRYSRGVFTSFTTKDGLSEDSLIALSTGSFAGIVVAAGSKVHRFGNGRFEVLDGIGLERDGRVEQLLGGADGSLWIGFHDTVLRKQRDGTLARYSLKQSRTPHVMALYEDPEGTIWIALASGLHRLTDGIVEALPAEDEGSRLGVVCSLFADGEGSLWIGLESNGLARMRTKQLKTLTAANGLPNDSTRSVFQDRHGSIWIGTATGLARYRDGRMTSYTAVGSSRLGSVRSFAEDRRGDLWIAAAQDLLLFKHGRLTRFPAWNCPSEIKVLYRDSKGRMWAGTDGDGLFQFEGNQVRNYRTNDGLASNQVRAILEDRRGALWIGTFAGISRLADGQFQTYTVNNGLASDRVLAVHEDAEGSLWFATRGGISRLRNGSFFTYTANSGLFVGFVYAILDDGRGNFWFSSAEGLFRVSQAELRDFAAGTLRRVTSVDYGVRDGMKTHAYNLGNQPTAWKTMDGSLMFCSMKGVVVVDPEHISRSHSIPPLRIESATINKEEQQPGIESRVPLGAGELEIHYAALNYSSADKVRFKYRVEGFDKEWVDAGARRFAYYANLPPGKYRFRVIAGDIDGPWNEQGATFDFFLQPRLYQTAYFPMLIGAGLILIAGLLYRLRVHGLKVRYSAVLAERNRIALEIHDTLAQNLTGIALQLDAVAMQTEGTTEAIRERLSQACNLTRYSLSEARRAVADLRSDELERRELATALPEIANRMAQTAGLKASVEVIGTPRRLNPTTEKNLLRIFQEAMANAIKHAHARSIDIELSYNPDQLLLQVKDDGGGFDTKEIIPWGSGHFGLTGMHERAERIGGRLVVKSQPGRGTELVVEVPFSD
jgi:ligand-binding sensor domain-containing protein/two-component sensor histidine kinase